MREFYDALSDPATRACYDTQYLELKNAWISYRNELRNQEVAYRTFEDGVCNFERQRHAEEDLQRQAEDVRRTNEDARRLKEDARHEEEHARRKQEDARHKDEDAAQAELAELEKAEALELERQREVARLEQLQLEEDIRLEKERLEQLRLKRDAEERLRREEELRREAARQEEEARLEEAARMEEEARLKLQQQQESARQPKLRLEKALAAQRRYAQALKDAADAAENRLQQAEQATRQAREASDDLHRDQQFRKDVVNEQRRLARSKTRMTLTQHEAYMQTHLGQTSRSVALICSQGFLKKENMSNLQGFRRRGLLAQAEGLIRYLEGVVIDPSVRREVEAVLKTLAGQGQGVEGLFPEKLSARAEMLLRKWGAIA